MTTVKLNAKLEAQIIAKNPEIKIWDRKVPLMGENAYGALILDGKGVLGRDVRAMLDIMIEPGIRFAPFQGLNSEQVFTALTDNGQTRKTDAKQGKDFWEGGGHNLMKNVLIILEAIIEKEKENKAVYIENYNAQENELFEDMLALEIAKREGIDTSSIEEQIQEGHAKLASIEKDILERRNFYWTPYSLNKLRKIVTSFIYGLNGRPNIANPKMFQLGQSLGLKFVVDEATGLDTKIDALETEVWAHSEILREGSPLNTALDFALNGYPTTEKNFTSSYEQTFDRMINPLMEGKKLCDYAGVDAEGNPILGTPWHMMEEGVDVSQIAYGKWVSFNLPEVIYGDAGVLIQNLVKSKVYNMVKIRPSNWADSGQRPIFVVIDECQEIVGNEDMKLLPMCRSLGMYVICATQQYESVFDAMGKNEKATNLFLNTFQSIVSFRTSKDSYVYLSERFGEAMLTVFEEKGVSIDYKAATMRVADSILNDDEHPNAAALSKVDRLGAGELATARYGGPTLAWEGSKAKKIGGRSLMDGIEVPSGGIKKVQPIIKFEELTTYLNVRGNAVVQIQRAGSKMIDFAKFDHIGVSDINKLFPQQQSGGN